MEWGNPFVFHKDRRGPVPLTLWCCLSAIHEWDSKIDKETKMSLERGISFNVSRCCLIARKNQSNKTSTSVGMPTPMGASSVPRGDNKMSRGWVILCCPKPLLSSLPARTTPFQPSSLAHEPELCQTTRRWFGYATQLVCPGEW